MTPLGWQAGGAKTKGMFAMTTVSLETAAEKEAAARRRWIAWRRKWAELGAKTGSPMRGFIAKATFLAIREEFGDFEAIAWPSVLLQGLNEEVTRTELYQALDDLVAMELIDLDASETGVYVDSVVREQEEDEYLFPETDCSGRTAKPLQAKSRSEGAA
jgi:hypothetical protein